MPVRRVPEIRSNNKIICLLLNVSANQEHVHISPTTAISNTAWIVQSLTPYPHPDHFGGGLHNQYHLTVTANLQPSSNNILFDLISGTAPSNNNIICLLLTTWFI